MRWLLGISGPAPGAEDGEWPRHLCARICDGIVDSLKTVVHTRRGAMVWWHYTGMKVDVPTDLPERE